MTTSSYRRGFSTIELLIAFAVATIFLSGIVLLAFGGQTATLDSGLQNGGLYRISTLIRDAVASTTQNWSVTLPAQTTNFYTQGAVTTDISPCLKYIAASTTWTSEKGRGQNLSLGTYISSASTAKALGGDCSPFPITDTWTNPQSYSTHNFNPGKPVALDVLNRVAYVTDDKGKLQIYDAKTDTLNNSSTFSITPYSDSGNKTLNDIDVAQWLDPATGAIKRYAYVVRNDTTNQFQVIDVTTPGSYTISAQKTLGGTIPPSGSFPQGWRVAYYDDHTYVTTRETAGFEFHTFDVSTPKDPNEVGPGFEVNGTVNDLTVTSTTVNGTAYKVAFLATDRSANEIMVLNVTNPAIAPTLIGHIDLGTTNNALSLVVISNKLYIGRQQTSGGAELLVYGINYAATGGVLSVTFSSSPLGSAEINDDVAYLRVAGSFVFIGVSGSRNEFDVININNLASGNSVPVNLGVNNKILCLDYENPYVYACSLATPALQIIYSGP